MNKQTRSKEKPTSDEVGFSLLRVTFNLYYTRFYT
jgi:hypothetical protein